jgi:hypothetical protein
MTPPKMLETASPHSLVVRELSGEVEKKSGDWLNKRLSGKRACTAGKVLGGRPLTSTEKKKKRSGWRSGYAPLALDYRFWIEEGSGCLCEECLGPQVEAREDFVREVVRERSKWASCPYFAQDSGCGCEECEGLSAELGRFEPVPVLSKHGHYPSLKWLKDEGQAKNPRVMLEYEILDEGTGEVYSDRRLAELRRSGVGPFKELVCFRWRGDRKERERIFRFWKGMSPPWWRNSRDGRCSECKSHIEKGQGLFERTKVLHRDGWLEKVEIAKTYCKSCFSRLYAWWSPPEEVIVDWEGEEPVVVSWEGIGQKLNGSGEKAKKRLKEAFVAAKRLSITFTEAAREQLKDAGEGEQKIAGAFAWNKALAEKYLAAGDLKRGQKVLNCRRCFFVYKCLNVRCGEEYTGGVNYACGDRVCAFCSDQRRHKALEDLLGKIRILNVKPEDISMFTFTTQNLVSQELTPDTWREISHRTNMAFALLACLGHRIPGAYRALETTYRSPELGHNIHCHALGEHDQAINQRLLERVWLVASGGAGYVCDIRRSKNLKRASLETIKNGKGTVKAAQRTVTEWVTEKGVSYLTKLTEMTDPHVLLATVKSMKGVHITQPLGRWRRAKSEVEPEPDHDGDLDHRGEPSSCSSCGGLKFSVRRRWLGFEKRSKKQNLDAVLALAATRKAQKASRGSQGP